MVFIFANTVNRLSTVLDAYWRPYWMLILRHSVTFVTSSVLSLLCTVKAYIHQTTARQFQLSASEIVAAPVFRRMALAPTSLRCLLSGLGTSVPMLGRKRKVVLKELWRLPVACCSTVPRVVVTQPCHARFKDAQFDQPKLHARCSYIYVGLSSKHAMLLEKVIRRLVIIKLF